MKIITKKGIALFFALFVFFISPQKIFAATLEIETFSDSALVPVLDGSAFTVTVPIKFEHVTYELRSSKQGSLLESSSFSDGVSMPSDRVLKFEYDGYYTIRFFEFNGQSEFDAENLYFTISGLKTFGSDTGGTTPPVTDSPTFDDSAILNKLEQIKNTLISEIYGSEINNQLSSLNTKTNSTNSKIDSTNSKIDTLNGGISTISGQLNNALGKMDTQIQLSKDIKSVATTIKNELQTTQTIKKPSLVNTKDALNANKPVQNQTSFQDNTTYFQDSGHNSNSTAVMPQAPEPEKWDGVAVPENGIQDGELITDSEKVIDVEKIADDEYVKEEIGQDVELSKVETIKDVELSKNETIKDVELSKDETIKDVQLSKDETVKDVELSKVETIKDVELSQDQMNQDNKYSQDSYYEKNNQYQQTEQNYTLRWKSENGAFK